MKINTYTVTPNLPEPIKHLRDIAMNLWSSWNWQVAQLFIRLDAETWEACRQNLVMTLGRIPQEVLEEAAEDESFVASLDRVWKELRTYLDAPTWFHDECPETDASIAYFSMEYGLDVGLPIYSGGLGILSGDHLKSASDLGLPLVAVGLMYQLGYFQQYLNSDGWQMERYTPNDWYNMPVQLKRDDKGKPIFIEVDTGAGKIKAQIWEVYVGRISLLLLDTNIDANPPALRQVAAQLYGGDRETRILQEMLLGIGGVRALKALNIEPTVYHMNEGHSAFLALERARVLIQEKGLSFVEAWEVIFSSTVFTTHTPVPAGNEAFVIDRIKTHLTDFSKSLGLSWEQFLQLGQEPGVKDRFSMTVLALNASAHCNGVSKLHGDVSRNMWNSLWNSLPVHEVPINHITNGVHTRSWTSHDLDDLLTRYIGPQFVDEPHDTSHWDRIDKIPDLELWRIHLIRKERLIEFARKRLVQQLVRRGAGLSHIEDAHNVLSSRALTIGFARRFATYKRADLILEDVERLKKLLLSSERPIQFIFAGKAHPHDDAGKEFIRQLAHFATDPEIGRRMVFLEDYDINVARYMVQGCDVWLNTPRRPLEASGTSGMKAAANGVINVSTLDGWWAEAYDPSLGWAIGSGESNGNPEELDRIESEALFNLLEEDIVPTYFELDRSQVPRQWIGMMKTSMKVLGSRFNTHRMVMDYCDMMYKPANAAGLNLSSQEFGKARALAEWRKTVFGKWSEVTVHCLTTPPEENLKTGDKLTVDVDCHLNGLKPEDVAVEAYFGLVDTNGEIQHGSRMRLNYKSEENNTARFSATLPCETSGRFGFAIRIRPDHADMVHPLTPFHMKWE
ncbi:alpha-glucan family phosphorylase [Calditrichota bacterium]